MASALSATEFGGQLVEKQPVEIGAVAESGVEFAAQRFGSRAASVIQAVSVGIPWRKSRHRRDQRLAGRRLRAGDYLPRSPVSTILPASMMATRCGDRAHHGEIVRDEEIGDVFLALQVEPAVRGSRRAPKRRAPKPPRRARSAPAWWRWRGRSPRAGAGRRRFRGCAGSARSGERPTRSSRRSDRRRPLGAAGDAVDAQRIVERAGHRGARVEGGERVLEHHLHARPARRAVLAPRSASRSCPSKWMPPASGSISRRRMRRERRLAAAGRADERQRLAAGDVQARRRRARRRGLPPRGKRLRRCRATASSGAFMRHPAISGGRRRGRYGRRAASAV